MEPIKLPTLVLPSTPDDGTVNGFVLGLPTLFVDGKEVDWLTMGGWRLEFAENEVATLHLALPVRVEVR